MANTREKLNWQTLDTTAFTGVIGKAWQDYTKAREPIQAEIDKLRAKLRPSLDTLENAVTAQMRAQDLIGPGQEVQFAYRFGGMAVAVAEARKASANKLVLGSSAPNSRRR